MKRTNQELKNRIHILTVRGETMNKGIIAKVKRELRKRGEEV
jgi:hypothetical protein